MLNVCSLYGQQFGIDFNPSKSKEVDCYGMHVAYRKIFRYIFKLPLWAHLPELMGILNIDPISILLNNKYSDFLKVNICSLFYYYY